MIYTAVVTYSVLCGDGKKRLRHTVEAFPSEGAAVAYIDNAAETWTDDARKYRYGSVHTIEEVA